MASELHEGVAAEPYGWAVAFGESAVRSLSDSPDELPKLSGV